MKPIIFIAMILTLFSSCKKSQLFTNTTLVGKWKLTEVFYGYTNGGDFQWHQYLYDKKIIFSQNNMYEEIEMYNGTEHKCVGTYNIQQNNIITFNTSCGTTPYYLKLSEQITTNIIIDAQVIEGTIRYKYVATP